MLGFGNVKDFNALSMQFAERMNPAMAAKMRAIEKLSHETDPQVLSLPHPARVTFMKQIEIAKLTYGDDWGRISKLICDNSLLLHQLTHKLIDTSEPFRLSYNITGTDLTGTNGGNASIQLLGLRFALNRGHVFQTTDALDEQLQHTDIADTIPVSQIRPPYPICYFEFGQSRKSPFVVPNEVTGDHVAEGCYVFEQRTSTLKGQPSKEHRHLIIMLTGMPKASVGDDSVKIYTIPILDEDLSIAETVAAFIQYHRDDIADARKRNVSILLKEADDEELAQLEEVLQHLMKIMLYLSTAKALTASNNARSQADKQIQAAPAGIMRKKREEKASRLYDRIVIGPKQLPKPEGLPSGPTGRHVSPHWRRGHFRDQRYGEGLKLIKNIYIEPVLVSAERIADGTDIPNKTYIIKS